jgi:GTPase SAR1 family protein
MRKEKAKAAKPYVCPYCFTTVDLTRIHYMCTNPVCVIDCNEKNAVKGRDGNDVYPSGRKDTEIDTESSRFLGKDPSGPGAIKIKQHVVRDHTGICDMCGRPAYKRLCPVCHNIIPQGIEDEDSEIFVVLGPKGVGKSHYIAVLINQLRSSFASEFNASMSAATDKTTNKYRDEYYTCLFEEHRKLPATKSAEDDRGVREPMIYYLRFFDEDRPKVYTLAFFDTAGEDLVTSGKILDLGLNSFIARSSGVVFLVDPLQIPYINKRIKVDNKPAVGPDPNDVLANISSIIRGNNKLKLKDRIDIPLAVVLTKCDVLMKKSENEEEEKVLLGPSSSITIERERGRYDPENFAQVDAELEEYMRRVVSREFTQQVKGYSRHCYFAVSALGNNPTGTSLSRGVSPMRVEDPFLWLLNCKGERRGG